MEGMNNELLTFLQHLREFGLVYLRKRSSGRFYPTRLALNITAGQNKVRCGWLSELNMFLFVLVKLLKRSIYFLLNLKKSVL